MKDSPNPQNDYCYYYTFRTMDVVVVYSLDNKIQFEVFLRTSRILPEIFVLNETLTFG